MAYPSKGRKPIERASKIAHGEIINTPDVVAYLKSCTVPTAPKTPDLARLVYPINPAPTHGIRAVVAIDGGFSETYIREDFPSVSLTFFQFGPLLFKLDDLRQVESQRFIAPEDLAALKKIERYTLTLPTRGIRSHGEPTLAASVRRTVYEFFAAPREAGKAPLLTTLVWFLFRRWRPSPNDSLEEGLANCPNPACDATNLSFRFNSPPTYPCPKCGLFVYLTDVFRLLERVDEEQGAGGIQTYVMTLLEQIVLIHVIRKLWQMKPAFLSEILFIKDGPLAFFGVVSPLNRPMRDLVLFLLDQPALNGFGRQPYLHLAGAEKSGAFVDHAAAIEPLLPAGHVMIPDNEYIYRYVVPGDPANGVYGHNTYYGSKVLYKGSRNDMYVLTIPTRTHAPAAPTPTDFPNLGVIIQLVAELRCNMYDNALIPIALANKLVSLSEVPSQKLLTEFAKAGVA